MPSTKDTVNAYMNAWNETNADKRSALLDAAWADSGTYTDPMADVSGRAGLSETIDGFHKQMPGASIALASGIDEHHKRIRFAWKLKAADGTVPIEGIDIGMLAEDGRLQSILGFWGNPPAE